ncbi:hypothetical protein CMUS01_06244, partial [Colletotrichum musicola]
MLEQLKQAFVHSSSSITKQQPRICLYGLGGIGKTQVALEYVYWLQEVRPKTSIFWVDARNKESFKKSYSQIAQMCGIPGRRNPSVDVLLPVKMWLQQKEHGPWFLVIDNAYDPDLFSLKAQDADHSVGSNYNTGDEGEFVNLVQFLPDCSHGSMLVTTRNGEAGLKLVPGSPPIEVEMMDDTESAQLVRAMMGDVGVTDDKISLLSRRLDYLPLALVQASAFMLERKTTIDRCLCLLDRSDEAVVHLLSPPDNAADRDSNVPHAVMLTWAVSFERIENQNELASTLLSLMALFDHQAIPKDLLTKCWTSVGVLSKSKSLSSASSLKRRHSTSPGAPSSEETSAAGAVGGDNSRESVRYPFQEGGSGGSPQWSTQAMTVEVWRKSNAGEVRINPTYPDSNHIEQYSSDMLDMFYNKLAIIARKKLELMPSYAADQVKDLNHHEPADFPASSSQSCSHMRSQSQCNDDLDQYARYKEDETRPGPREWTTPVGFTMRVSPPPVWMLPFDADLEARFTRIRSASPSLWEDSSSSVFFTELEKALGVLKAHCLITEESDGSMAMHRLVQLAARKWHSKDTSESSFEREALHAM